MGVIGDTLSAARTRRAVDLEEVHAVTGIRPRYLQAIEDEDWDALPEEFYVRSFIRKYARFLGVEPEPLVEEYRRQRGAARPGAEPPTSPFGRTTSRRAEALRRRRARQGVYAWLGAAAVVVAVVVVIVLLASGGRGGSKGVQAGGGNGAAGGGGKTKGAGKHAGGGGGGGKNAKGTVDGEARASSYVTLKIEPTAEVWTCVLDASGKPLVDGATLDAGETAGPFHSRSYTAAFGNGSVELWVDGKRVDTPSTPSPMGLSIARAGKVHTLPEGSRPSCE